MCPMVADAPATRAGLAADSGCGKSTFMRRVTACFGGECKLNDIGRETNTLISDMTTVICLDDFHSNDRNGRKVSGTLPSAPRAPASPFAPLCI